MPLSEFKQGAVICGPGEELQHLYFITKGSVDAVFDLHTIRLEAGDAIGICALGEGSHGHSYTAVTDVSVLPYPYENFNSLLPLLRDNVDVANRLVNSMCSQVSELLQFWSSLKQEANKAYELAKGIYPQYERLSALYVLASKKLPAVEELVAPLEPYPVGDWLQKYYTEIKDLDFALQKSFFRKPAISLGFLHKGAEDIFQIMQSCKAYQEYLQSVSGIFMCKDGLDLFELVSELHINASNMKGADAAVEALMKPMMGLVSNMTYVDREYYKERLKTYKDALANRSGAEMVSAQSSGGVKQNLADSLNIILEYSGCPDEVCNQFARYIDDFTRLSDRNSSDDSIFRMRKEIAVIFYEIYKSVFVKSLNDYAPPTIIKMFLNFGYVDATLAGYENADYLYSIADSIKGDPELGVYTICEWLTAVYNGEREPSRNDFDMDYTAHVQELKSMRKIDAKEEARLLADREAKLRFEMDNVFPIVNKLTFGRITTFCPLFADNNVQRGLDASLVTPSSIKETIDEIRRIDFSAYYRETLYSNAEGGVPKESVHVEVLPEIILMPNIGTRSIMWQEIEGRKRTTPARMFISIFLLTELKTLITRLTGEFRWEMCKRIQGPRWNDLSDRSLTSEYFDYLQFYRSNRDLSLDAKSAIKTEIIRARNNYKEVFVLNYLEWLQYEAKGSPRLNKIARRIMFEYCPFSVDVRETLTLNPQYADPLKRYHLKQHQREQLLSRVIQKVEQSHKRAPQELYDELEYLKR